MWNRNEETSIYNNTYVNADPQQPQNSGVAGMIFALFMIAVVCVVFASALDAVAALVGGLVAALATLITGLLALVNAALPWALGFAALTYVAGLVADALPWLAQIWQAEQRHRHEMERARIMLTAPPVRRALEAKSEPVALEFVCKEAIDHDRDS